MYLLECVDEGEPDKMNRSERSLCAGPSSLSSLDFVVALCGLKKKNIL